MKKDDVFEFLDCVGAVPSKKQARAKWVTSSCPMVWNHKDGKSSADVFGVKLEQGDPLCHCFACGWGDSALGTTLEIKRQTSEEYQSNLNIKRAMEICVQASDDIELEFEDVDYEEALKKDEVTVFDDWWIETFPSVQQSALGMHYLNTRLGGPIDPDVIKFLDLRFDPNQKRVCAPVKNKKNQFVGLHGRAIYDDIDPRYRMYTYKGKNNPQYWLGENWVDLEQPLVVVEGYFDMARVLPVWPNVATPLFANPSIEKMKRMAGASEIITFFDWGAGGDFGRERFQKQFGSTHLISHCKPPAGVKDPGACTHGQIFSALGPFLPI
jgi:hypothetical protein